MVDGNFTVKLRRHSGEVFVWKKTEVAVTPERASELESFKIELQGILESPTKQ
jgi:hypothetical protein